MLFVRSLLGVNPGRVAFKAASTFVEAAPQSTFSLLPIGINRRWQSTEANPKDVVSCHKMIQQVIYIPTNLFWME
jgi:elongation factor G